MSSIILPGAPFSGVLALIGGGEFSFGETREIDEILLARLPQGARIAFLPTASGSSEYASHFGRYIQSIRSDVSVMLVPVYRGRDARREKNLVTIRESQMVYVGGGVTNTLLHVLRGSPVVDTIRLVLSGGGIVACIGAGAAAMGALSRSMTTVGAPLEGLAIVDRTIIEPLFAPENDTRLRQMMSDARVDVGVGIPMGTALILENGEGRIAGNAQVAVFRKSQESSG